MNLRREVPPGCLSGWRVSRAATSSLAPDERAAVEAHLARCARCAELVRLERADVAAASLEPIPARVSEAFARAAAPSVRRAWWRGSRAWLSGLGVAAAVAVALVVAWPRGGGEVGLGDGPIGAGPIAGGVRPKGAMAIEATVLRGEIPVASDQPVGALGVLKDGDAIRLRVRNAFGARVRVESFEAGRWEVIHESDVPADGWVPLALVATAGSETRLRVTVCDRAADLALAATPGQLPERCLTETHPLDVR